jgi:hypothetical protein
MAICRDPMRLPAVGRELKGTMLSNTLPSLGIGFRRAESDWLLAHEEARCSCA